MARKRVNPGQHLTIRLRSTDEELAKWLSQQENLNDVILQVLREHISGQSSQPTAHTFSCPASNRDGKLDEILQALQRIESHIVHSQTVPGYQKEEVPGGDQEGKPQETEEVGFGSLAAAIINF